MINFSILEFQDGGRQTAGAPPPLPPAHPALEMKIGAKYGAAIWRPRWT